MPLIQRSKYMAVSGIILCHPFLLFTLLNWEVHQFSHWKLASTLISRQWVSEKFAQVRRRYFDLCLSLNNYWKVALTFGVFSLFPISGYISLKVILHLRLSLVGFHQIFMQIFWYIIITKKGSFRAPNHYRKAGGMTRWAAWMDIEKAVSVIFAHRDWGAWKDVITHTCHTGWFYHYADFLNLETWQNTDFFILETWQNTDFLWLKFGKIQIS